MNDKPFRSGNGDNNNNNSGKILPFRQDIDFYLSQAEKKLDRNDLLAATERYRRAFLSDPSDLDACLALADMLGRMQRYEESNRILLVDMSMNDPDPESYFGLACNYYGMQEFDYARESLETYLQMEPDGNYADDAAEFLEVLNDESELRYAIGSEKESSETLMVCARARRLSETGNIPEADSMLTDYIERYPDALRAKHTLASVRFMQDKKEDALKLVEEVIHADRLNVSARCSKVLFLRTLKRNDEADREMDAILSLRVDFGVEELGAIALLQLEAEQWEKALNTCEQLTGFLPYDPLALHHLASARYMLGDDDGAAECYRTLLRIDPDDTVAKFYAAHCRRKKPTGKRHAFPLTYQVPITEIVRRLHKITQSLTEDKENFVSRWKNDRAFRNLLVWSISIPGDKYTAEMLSIIASAGDEDAERVIRDFLLRTDKDDTLKHYAVSLIGRLNPDRCVMLFCEGAWIRGELTDLQSEVKLPMAYECMLAILANNVANEDCPQKAVQAMGDIMHTLYDHYNGKLPPMTKERMLATAAALEVLGRSGAGLTVDKKAIASRYHVTLRRLENAILRLTRILAEARKEQS